MADIYSPWMAGSEEDVTSMGLATPEYMEMYAEAQAGPGSEAEVEMETEPEIETPEESADTGDSIEMQGGMHSTMQLALQTINQQSSVISQLLASMKQ